VFSVALVETGVVDVEGIGVLHDELSHAEQAGLGTRLVAELGLDLVPDLRELLVAAQLVARDGGHDLFVGHPQAEVGSLAVLQAEHIVAHGLPAARLFPYLAGVQSGEQELLADLVHLFAHDGGDLVNGAIAQKKIAVDTGAELSDIASAKKELVTGNLSVCRGFTKGGDEQLRPAMHR
jgi:hypothetical protein